MCLHSRVLLVLMPSPSPCILKLAIQYTSFESVNELHKHIYAPVCGFFFLNAHFCAASHDLSFVVLRNVCLPLQGLPGPPGEKGENGDVGAMVSFSSFCRFSL